MRTQLARKHELDLKAALREKRDAVARLEACETELAALKIEHDDLTRRARLATYMRASSGLRTGQPAALTMPPEGACHRRLII